MRGRRRDTYPSELRKDLVERFQNYLLSTSIPSVVDFAQSLFPQIVISSQTFYDFDEFSTLIKICHDKKENGLERGMQRGDINPGYGNFALKQLGWTDKVQNELSGDLNIVRIALPVKKSLSDPVTI
jgi:hypothetical protein